MCSFLGKIQATGFFEVAGDGSLCERDPIYRNVESTCMGEGEYIISVNGRPSKLVTISKFLADSLVPPVKSVYELLEAYRPGGMTAFHPDRVPAVLIRMLIPAAQEERVNQALTAPMRDLPLCSASVVVGGPTCDAQQANVWRSIETGDGARNEEGAATSQPTAGAGFPLEAPPPCRWRQDRPRLPASSTSATEAQRQRHLPAP